jgi:hypothetical protein
MNYITTENSEDTQRATKGLITVELCEIFVCSVVFKYLILNMDSVSTFILYFTTEEKTESHKGFNLCGTLRYLCVLCGKKNSPSLEELS